MNIKCLTLRETFQSWVGMKYSGSEKVSLDTDTGTSAVIGIKMPKDYKSNAEFKARSYTPFKRNGMHNSNNTTASKEKSSLTYHCASESYGNN